MPMNLDAVGSSTEPSERAWSSADCLLYALGVGAGASDPTGFELAFTTENSRGIEQLVLPTFATIVGAGSRGGARETESKSGDLSRGGRTVEFPFGTIDPAMLVHGEQVIELFGPIPVAGRVKTTTTVTGIYDKGSGALVTLASRSVDAVEGTPRFQTTTSLFVRGEGGFGGERGSAKAASGVPDRPPDQVVTYETRRDQGLLYRLSGDRNPLHSDPEFAKRAGFTQPILHGLCTYGFTGRALLHALCGSDPSRFGAMSGRFTNPVEPGDTLEVAIWTGDEGARFQTTTGGGRRVVIDGGSFRYA